MPNQYRIYYDNQTPQDAITYQANSFLHAAILSAAHRIATDQPITFVHITELSTGKTIKARIELKQYNFVSSLQPM